MERVMKVLFQCEQLNYRGTTNSILDYARYNQEILGNESVIVYEASGPQGLDVGSSQSVIDEISKKFPVYTYNDENHLNKIAEKYDFCYSQRAGLLVDDLTKKRNPLVTSTKFGVHCVFQWYGPHGDVYAYISKWLAGNVSKLYNAPLCPHVPYIVDLPPPNEDLRKKFGIPKDKYVIGRIGGFNTFDLPHVHNAVRKIAEERDDILFILANTQHFSNHRNIMYVEPFFDAQLKSNYIDMCDAMLHGRQLGETFGLSISEFLFHNKPVLSWSGGFDRNHVDMLEKFDLLYNNEIDVYNRILGLRDRAPSDYRSIVAPFSPKAVMETFRETFLDPSPTLGNP
jgi:hypothetical protein